MALYIYIYVYISAMANYHPVSRGIVILPYLFRNTYQLDTTFLRCVDRNLGIAPNRSLFWFGILGTQIAPNRSLPFAPANFPCFFLSLSTDNWDSQTLATLESKTPWYMLTSRFWKTQTSASDFQWCSFPAKYIGHLVGGLNPPEE